MPSALITKLLPCDEYREGETNEEAPPTSFTPPKIRPPYSQWLNDFAIASFGQQKKAGEKKARLFSALTASELEKKKKSSQTAYFTPKHDAVITAKCLMPAAV